MTELEILALIRAKVRFHIRDVSATDLEMNQVIIQTIEDIGQDTAIFKKVFGFTVHKDKSLYDFRNMLLMNEQVEEELSSVYIGDISDQDLIDFLADPTDIPSPEINKTTFIEDTAKSSIIKLMDIFDEAGKSVNHKFHYHGISNRFVEDQNWLDENDGKNFAFVAAVKPRLTELLPEDLSTITSAIIEGCSITSMIHSQAQQTLKLLTYSTRDFGRRSKSLLICIQHTYSL